MPDLNLETIGIMQRENFGIRVIESQSQIINCRKWNVLSIIVDYQRFWFQTRWINAMSVWGAWCKGVGSLTAWAGVRMWISFSESLKTRCRRNSAPLSGPLYFDSSSEGLHLAAACQIASTTFHSILKCPSWTNGRVRVRLKAPEWRSPLRLSPIITRPPLARSITRWISRSFSSFPEGIFQRPLFS